MSLDVRLVLGDDQLRAIAEAVAELLRTDAHAESEPWPNWMNVETASRYLDVSVERLRKLKERRAIQCHQEGPGCRVFFKRTDLDDWMAEFRQSARDGGGA